jgi:hypothetical protein
MKIELLHIDDCPSWQEGLKNLKTALEAEGLEADIRVVHVQDDVEAARLKFIGSPSFCLDGEDLWPEERKRYNLNCRIYATPQGLKGCPTVDMLREKLHAQAIKNVGSLTRNHS